MTTRDMLVRRVDGKQFKPTFVSHWSDIQSVDGETDSVKWYGVDAGKMAYVSASKGFSYLLIERA